MATHTKKATLKPPPPGSRAGSGAGDAIRLAPAERLLRIGEVARMLRVSRTTVYYMIRRGDLPSLCVANMQRVRLRDLTGILRLRARKTRGRRSQQVRKVGST